MRRHFAALLFAAVACPTSAWASGSLLVSLQDDSGRPVEGMATATPEGGGPARTCSTQGGRCTILGLTPGRFRVGATLVRGGMVPAGLVVVQEGRPASVRLTSVAMAPPAPIQQHGASGRGQGHGPVVLPGGQQGGTHGGPQPVGPRGVTVQPGPQATVQSVQPAKVRTLRPGMPGQGPQPVVVQPGHPGPQAVGGTVVMGGAQAEGGGGGRNLASGRSASVRGHAQDQRGRPVEGTVSVSQSGRAIGAVSTTGGSFTCFDLPPGTYTFSFTAVSGQRTSRDVSVAPGAASSVRLAVVR